jgi:hypothetical protein
MVGIIDRVTPPPRSTRGEIRVDLRHVLEVVGRKVIVGELRKHHQVCFRLFDTRNRAVDIHHSFSCR